MRVDQGRTVNPGVLRHQITWQRKTVTGQDSFGADVVTWPDLVTCRAQVKELQGRELTAVQQRWAEAKYEILQHRHAGLKESDRISWYIDGEVRTLDVLGIQDPPGTARYLLIVAKDHVE